MKGARRLRRLWVPSENPDNNVLSFGLEGEPASPPQVEHFSYYSFVYSLLNFITIYLPVLSHHGREHTTRGSRALAHLSRLTYIIPC